MSIRVLVVDDHAQKRQEFITDLEKGGISSAGVGSVDEASRIFQRNQAIDVALVKSRLPVKDGLSLLEVVQESFPHVRVILMDGQAGPQEGVSAFKAGVADYFESGATSDQLIKSVIRQLRKADEDRRQWGAMTRLESRAEKADAAMLEILRTPSKDPAMSKVNEWISILRKDAMRNESEEVTVLIEGEEGCGKENLARVIHSYSRRGKLGWTSFNSATVAPEELETVLFGTDQTPGVIESAQGGTLYLSHAEAWPDSVQIRIFKLLTDKVIAKGDPVERLPVDVRLIVSSTESLEKCVQQGSFRNDTYQQISRVTIEHPALRERTAELAELASRIAEQCYRYQGKKFPGFAADAERGIRAYRWPGNLREFQMVMERMGLIGPTARPVSEADLSLSVKMIERVSAPQLTVVPQGLSVVPTDLEDTYISLKKKWLESFEREYLISTLKRYQGNVSAAAREARLDRSNYLRLLRKYSIKAHHYRQSKVAETTAAPQLTVVPEPKAA